MVLSVTHHALQPRGVALSTVAEITLLLLLLLLPLPRGTAMAAPSQTHSCRKLRFTIAVSLGQLRSIGGVRGPLDSPDTLRAMSKLEATRTPAVGSETSTAALDLDAVGSGVACKVCAAKLVPVITVLQSISTLECCVMAELGQHEHRHATDGLTVSTAVCSTAGSPGARCSSCNKL
jgi:hypothetical protein